MPKKTARRDRNQILKQIPWVTYLKEGQQCDGMMNKTTRKHLFGTDEQRAQKPRCKNPAHWRFKALKKSWARDGVYCQSHLLHRCLYGDMDEEARTQRWLEKHHPELFEE